MGDREYRNQRNADIVDYLAELATETHESQTLRRNRGVATNVGREQLFLNQLHGSMVEVFSQIPSLPKYKAPKAKGTTKRILNLVLSDTHYGSDLDPREVGHKYGPVEEARRTAFVLREAAEYKLRHRDETELYMHILGDMIQGKIHDKEAAKPITEQAAACMGILTQAILFAATKFRKVTVRCVPGNHGRNPDKHKDRAMSQKWDAIETMIYLGVRNALTNVPNVNMVVDYKPSYEFALFDNLGYATHGDTHINMGWPGKSVNTFNLKRQLDSMNNARMNKGEKQVKVVIGGHVHTGMMVQLPGGMTAMTNPCLLPPDAYAQSAGYPDTNCGQWLFESTPEYPVGDARIINVGFDTDKIKALDDIIKPIHGL